MSRHPPSTLWSLCHRITKRPPLFTSRKGWRDCVLSLGRVHFTMGGGPALRRRQRQMADLPLLGAHSERLQSDIFISRRRGSRAESCLTIVTSGLQAHFLPYPSRSDTQKQLPESPEGSLGRCERKHVRMACPAVFQCALCAVPHPSTAKRLLDPPKRPRWRHGSSTELDLPMICSDRRKGSSTVSARCWSNMEAGTWGRGR